MPSYAVLVLLVAGVVFFILSHSYVNALLRVTCWQTESQEFLENCLSSWG